MKKSTKRSMIVGAVVLCAVALSSTVTSKPKPKHSSGKPANQAPFKRTVFKPLCATPTYPLPAPATKPAIDSLCGVAGSGTGPEGAQNSAKNNFCAKGTPQAITIPDLTNLQGQVEKNPAINFGSESKGARKKGPTVNRAPLKKLGEGKLVTLKAYVLIARQEGAESVNCEKNVPDDAQYHDIHISLVQSTDDEECSGVVAEMSPHHRPDSWKQVNVEKVSKAKLLVRVTGHLYFDSSHFPCTGGQSAGEGNPKRISLWEIHPIYKFEVCTADCGGAGTWVPLDQWVAQQK